MKTSSWNWLTSCPITRQEHTHTHRHTHRRTHTHSHIGTQAHTQTHRHMQATQLWPLQLLSQHSSQYDSLNWVRSHHLSVKTVLFGSENGGPYSDLPGPCDPGPQRPSGVLCAWAPSHSHSGPLAGPQTPVSSGPGALQRPNLPEWSSLRHPHGSFRSQVSVSRFSW